MKNALLTKVDYAALLKSPKKGLRRQVQIAEATIDLLHRDGLTEFSYDHLAKKCQISRGVIYNHFPTLTDLLLFTCGMIRFRYQSLVIEKVSSQKTPERMLRAYAEAALSWVDVEPKHATIWLLFFHQCCVSSEIAQHNRQWVDIGTQRIAAILEAGIKSGCLGIEARECVSVARQVQLLVTGGLISSATEKRTPQEHRAERDMIINVIMELARIR